MIAKSIISGLVAFLTVLGCMVVYQRETSIINNQVTLTQYVQQNEAWKQEAAKVINQLAQKNNPKA